MATGDQFDQVHPNRFVRENGVLGYSAQIAAGGISGVPLAKLDTQGYQFMSRIPANGTPLATGLTFSLLLTDDPNNPGPGLVVRLGITVKRLVSGTDDLTQAGASAETLASVTIPAGAGVAIVASVAIANAALDSIAASDRYIVRFRRISSAALDTHQGTVVVSDVTVRDT